MGFLNLGHRFVNLVTRLILDLNIIMEVDKTLVENHIIEEATEKF